MFPFQNLEWLPLKYSFDATVRKSAVFWFDFNLLLYLCKFILLRERQRGSERYRMGDRGIKRKIEEDRERKRRKPNKKRKEDIA